MKNNSLLEYKPVTDEAALAAMLFDMMKGFDYFQITNIEKTADTFVSGYADGYSLNELTGGGTLTITGRWYASSKPRPRQQWKIEKGFKVDKFGAPVEPPKKVWRVVSADGVVAQFKSKSAAGDCAYAHNLGLPPEAEEEEPDADAD